MRRTAVSALAALIAGALIVVGAGAATRDPGTGVEAESRPAATVAVAFDEWRIDAGRVATGGHVTLDERNLGRQQHDLVIVRTDRPADDLPVGLDGVAAELAGDVVLGHAETEHAHGVGDAHEDQHLRPGARRRRTVTLEPGSYVLFCPLPGHYARGQHAALTLR